MNERTIFIEALEIESPDRRVEFLDSACGGDTALRQRVEALLESHEQAGEFLAKLAPERLAEELAAEQGSEPTLAGAPAHEHTGEELGFLAPSSQPGSLGELGHYDIREVVGRGGMGIVLRAFDERLHRVVAIKVMAAQLATSVTARKRFLREARAAAAVSHDHIVTIHAVEEALLPSPLGGEGPGVRGLPYIVMQYVAGMSLEERLQRGGPLALHEILRIGMQTASGLAAAHAQGLIHRDIKPANILLENGVERVRITDFGLARAAADASLTQSGAVAGTPHYMAPEQARGDALDARTDLFSLGSVLYAMCTGRSPFRAGSSIAVLKRVCEDAPTPIREINPEIPEWLVAIIEKLHAKDPAERFQSAAEVADLLGRHLAHVQHPSVAPLPPSLPSASGGLQPPDKRTVEPAVDRAVDPAVDAAQSGGLRPPLAHAPTPRWAIAAAILLVCLFGGLTLTEATGVTNLRATAIRIFTPDGVLVVETDDPAVKVTVEGDGGLVITGAGLEEIRLRPGSYRVQADRDGKPVPLDKDLVTVARGGRAIVKVKLEAAPAIEGVTAEQGAFVVLAAGQERKFDTLAEAVQGASDGDTIEIRGNGPFVNDGVTVRQPLVIRAGEGYKPSITLSQASVEKRIPLINASASLVLEGLELRGMGAHAEDVETPFLRLIKAWHDGSLHVANCRLLFAPGDRKGALIGAGTAVLALRNCELLGDTASPIWRYDKGGRCSIVNCVSTVGPISFYTDEPGVMDLDASIDVRGNSLVGNCMTYDLWSNAKLEEKTDAAPPIQLQFSSNVARWDANDYGRGILFFHQPFPPAKAEGLLPRLIQLVEHRNVYQSGTAFLRLGRDGRFLEGTCGQDLADWDRFWSQHNTGSFEGEVRFEGGDLLSRARTAAKNLTADDFRLRPDSAGYRAGPDGKDLGADVDLVGPGEAYERWKQTPEYREWREETRHLITASVEQGTDSSSPAGEDDTGYRSFPSASITRVRRLAGHTGGVTQIAVFRDGSRCLTASHDGTVRLWEIPTSKLLHTFRFGDYYWRAPVALAPEEQLAAAGMDREGTILLFNVETGKPLNELSGHSDAIAHLEFSPDGRRLLSRSRDETLRLWDVESGKELRRLNCAPWWSGAVAFSRDGDAILYGDGGFLVRWNIESESEAWRAGDDEPASQVGSVVLSPDGRRVAAGAFGGPIHLRNAQTGELLGTFVGHPPQSHSVIAFTPDGRHLVSGNNVDKTLRVWSVETFSEICRIKADRAIVNKLAVLPDGRHVITAGGMRYKPLAEWIPEGDYDLHLWRLPEGVWPQESATVEKDAFVVLGGGAEVAKFDTLAEAVLGASDGDTIEIRGNGPFVSKPIVIGQQVLTIRAGEGHAPVIKVDSDEIGDVLLNSQGLLVLEGLDLEWVNAKPGGPGRHLVVSNGPAARLYAANCRFLMNRREGSHNMGCVGARDSALCVLRNCQILVSGQGSFYPPFAVGGGPESKLIVENCLIGQEVLVYLSHAQPMKAVLNHNTFLGERFMTFRHYNAVDGSIVKPGSEPLQILASGNILGGPLMFVQLQGFLKEGTGFGGKECEQALKQLIGWHDAGNLYWSPESSELLRLFLEKEGELPRLRLSPTNPVTSLSAWKDFWGQDSLDATRGVVRFHGGDLIAKAKLDPQALTPQDFRLRPDSPGYRAGPDGKDLGADVDLVGPGAAYERWKNTPEYQEWLKEIGQTGFVPLFNGEDLTGWKSHPEQPGAWTVKDGVLHGSPGQSYLFSERGDFGDFHLRVEAKINNGGDSSVCFRAPFQLQQWGAKLENYGISGGYDVELQKNPFRRLRTGSITVAHTRVEEPSEVLFQVTDDSLIRPDEWFVLEVIAEGNRLIVKVNGRLAADCRDPLNRHHLGHIALHVFNAGTAVQFRKIEIKELEPKAFQRLSDDAAERELAAWQGEWENADYGRLVIQGERWSSYPKNGFEVVSTIKIVEVTDEMTHILLLNAGIDGKVRTIQTILRVDGDTLHNCGTMGPIRPTEFANKPGWIYTQWKRVTQAPP